MSKQLKREFTAHRPEQISLSTSQIRSKMEENVASEEPDHLARLEQSSCNTEYFQSLIARHTDWVGRQRVAELSLRRSQDSACTLSESIVSNPWQDLGQELELSKPNICVNAKDLVHTRNSWALTAARGKDIYQTNGSKNIDPSWLTSLTQQHQQHTYVSTAISAASPVARRGSTHASEREERSKPGLGLEPGEESDPGRGAKVAAAASCNSPHDVLPSTRDDRDSRESLPSNGRATPAARSPRYDMPRARLSSTGAPTLGVEKPSKNQDNSSTGRRKFEAPSTDLRDKLTSSARLVLYEYFALSAGCRQHTDDDTTISFLVNTVLSTHISSPRLK